MPSRRPNIFGLTLVCLLLTLGSLASASFVSQRGLTIFFSCIAGYTLSLAIQSLSR